MAENTKLETNLSEVQEKKQQEGRLDDTVLTQKQISMLTAQLTEYIKNVHSWKRLFWINLLAGISRGLGFALGTTLIIAIIVKILSNIVALNIPYITDWIAQIIQMAQIPGY